MADMLPPKAESQIRVVAGSKRQARITCLARHIRWKDAVSFVQIIDMISIVHRNPFHTIDSSSLQPHAFASALDHPPVTSLIRYHSRPHALFTVPVYCITFETYILPYDCFRTYWVVVGVGAGVSGGSRAGLGCISIDATMVSFILVCLIASQLTIVVAETDMGGP